MVGIHSIVFQQRRKKAKFECASIIIFNGFTCALEEDEDSFRVGGDTTLKWKYWFENDSMTKMVLQSIQVVALAISFLQPDSICTNSCCFTQNILTCSTVESSWGCSKCEAHTNCNNSRQVFAPNQASSKGISKVFPPSMRNPSITKKSRLRHKNEEIQY